LEHTSVSTKWHVNPSTSNTPTHFSHEIFLTYWQYRSKITVKLVTQARFQMKAGSLIQAGGSRSLILIHTLQWARRRRPDNGGSSSWKDWAWLLRRLARPSVWQNTSEAPTVNDGVCHH